jgi:hydrogenase maturation protease
MRILIAAFGNELRGDDGFGIAVLRQLEARPTLGAPGAEVRLLEVGTGGIQLAQELLSPWDRLIIIDAVNKGSPPGTVHVMKVEDVPEAREIDVHLAVPARALSVAKALHALPSETFLVGCEPVDVDELTMELSEAVRAAVPIAACHVEALMKASR